MKIVNPSGPRKPTPAQTIVRILARMSAKERLRKEVARRRRIVESAEKSRSQEDGVDD